MTVAVYWPVWFAQFLSVDDHLYVTNNPIVQRGLTLNGLIWAFSAPHAANYHPLTWLSHMLDCQFFGVDPRWHHAINLVFHCLNVVLVYLVLRSMTGRNRCSAVVAALFAIHPVHVESVAWVSERKDVLSGDVLFPHARGMDVVCPARWRMAYGTALTLFAMGLLCKPMLVTVPALLLLIDIWPLGRTRWAPAESLRTDEDPPMRSWRFLIAEKVPFAALAVACSIITMFAQAEYGAMVSSDQGPLSMRLGNAVVSYVRYARNFHLAGASGGVLSDPPPLAGDDRLRSAGIAAGNDRHLALDVALAPVSRRRLALVSRNARPGDRPRASRQPGDG